MNEGKPQAYKHKGENVNEQKKKLVNNQKNSITGSFLGLFLSVLSLPSSHLIPQQMNPGFQLTHSN